MSTRDPDTGDAVAGAEATARTAADAFRVALPPLRPGEPPFEGPLDLILHLVKEHEVDLFDIPIAKITESYLATLEALRELDIDLAGEFLHMAAQLVLMKSKLLLPRTEVAEEPPADDAGVDPRAELVRRLLEYQKYKAAGEELGSRGRLVGAGDRVARLGVPVAHPWGGQPSRSASPLGPAPWSSRRRRAPA